MKQTPFSLLAKEKEAEIEERITDLTEALLGEEPITLDLSEQVLLLVRMLETTTRRNGDRLEELFNAFPEFTDKQLYTSVSKLVRRVKKYLVRTLNLASSLEDLEYDFQLLKARLEEYCALHAQDIRALMHSQKERKKRRRKYNRKRREEQATVKTG